MAHKSLNVPRTKALKLSPSGKMHKTLVSGKRVGKEKMETEIECSSLSWPQGSHVMKPTLSSNSPLSLSSRRLIFIFIFLLVFGFVICVCLFITSISPWSKAISDLEVRVKSHKIQLCWMRRRLTFTFTFYRGKPNSPGNSVRPWPRLTAEVLISLIFCCMGLELPKLKDARGNLKP